MPRVYSSRKLGEGSDEKLRAWGLVNLHRNLEHNAAKKENVRHATEDDSAAIGP